MAIKLHDRKYDIVLYGATGYTGKLISFHIVSQLPQNLRWAIAGRDRAKLVVLVATLRRFDLDRMPPIMEVTTPETLSQLAASARVMISAVGPYLLHGEAAFEACVREGTHYIDVSGETPFLSRMLAKYSGLAEQTGSVLISQTGIESVPADVLTWAVANRAVTEFNEMSAHLGHVSFSMDLRDAFSGGSIASVLEFLGNVPLAELKATHAPYALSPVPNPRPAKDKYPLPALLGVRRIPHLGLQTKSIFGTTDCVIVWRTWGLMEKFSKARSERVLNGGGAKEGLGGLGDDPSHHHNHHYPYGARFSFGETTPCKSYISGIAQYFGMVLVGALITMSSLFRAIVSRCMYKPGEGRSGNEMMQGRGEFIAVGEIVDGKGRGRRVRARAEYMGSAYAWTGVFAAEAAMVLLEGEISLPGGILTPACLGQPYIDRLRGAGFAINVELME